MPTHHLFEKLRAWNGGWPLEAVASAPSTLPDQRVARQVRIWGVREDEGDLLLTWEDQDGHTWTDGFRVTRSGEVPADGLALVSVAWPAEA